VLAAKVPVLLREFDDLGGHAASFVDPAERDQDLGERHLGAVDEVRIAAGLLQTQALLEIRAGLLVVAGEELGPAQALERGGDLVVHADLAPHPEAGFHHRAGARRLAPQRVQVGAGPQSPRQQEIRRQGDFQ
jgi:hypothetical protein